MPIDSGTLTAQQIIDDFRAKVGKLIEEISLGSSNTAFTINETSGLIAGNRSNGFDRTGNIAVSSFAGITSVDTVPPNVNGLGAATSTPTGNAIRAQILAAMQLYTRYHTATLRVRNTSRPLSNAAPVNARLPDVRKNLVIRFNSDIASKSAAVTTAVNTAATTHSISGATPPSAINVSNFINECQIIWATNCKNTAGPSFTMSYCHGNHSNHSSHGSRGRR